jgi:hypothetical protein
MQIDLTNTIAEATSEMNRKKQAIADADTLVSKQIKLISSIPKLYTESVVSYNPATREFSIGSTNL